MCRPAEPMAEGSPHPSLCLPHTPFHSHLMRPSASAWEEAFKGTQQSASAGPHHAGAALEATSGQDLRTKVRLSESPHNRKEGQEGQRVEAHATPGWLWGYRGPSRAFKCRSLGVLWGPHGKVAAWGLTTSPCSWYHGGQFFQPYSTALPTTSCRHMSCPCRDHRRAVTHPGRLGGGFGTQSSSSTLHNRPRWP